MGNRLADRLLVGPPPGRCLLPPESRICVKSRAIPFSKGALNWLVKPVVGRDLLQEKGPSDGQFTAVFGREDHQETSLSTRKLRASMIESPPANNPRVP